MKAKKIEPVLTHIHDTGFGGVECQFQDVHNLLDCLQGIFGVSFSTADDDEVIRITDKYSKRLVTLRPEHIQHMQVDVCQQGADDAALRRPNLGSITHAIF